MTPTERAEKIYYGLGHDVTIPGQHKAIAKIAAQIEEAERETLKLAMKNWKPVAPILDLEREKGYKEGFSAGFNDGFKSAKEKAKGIALNCADEYCLIDEHKHIADRIGKMSPTDESTLMEPEK